MINAIAIDDEPLALKVIENFCKKVPFVQLEKTFSQPTEALRHLNKYPVDLIFLDIQMPSITGIELYKSLKQNTMVIFTTAYSQYAVEGFELNAIDYLLKPYTPERFEAACNKARDFYQYTHKEKGEESAHFFVRADYSLIKIEPADIMLIEGLDDYLKIHLTGGKTVVARMTMKGILEKLPSTQFSRIHRSFIVPLAKVEKVYKKTVTVNGQEIPIGSSYEDDFLKVIQK